MPVKVKHTIKLIWSSGAISIHQGIFKLLKIKLPLLSLREICLMIRYILSKILLFTFNRVPQNI